MQAGWLVSSGSRRRLLKAPACSLAPLPCLAHTPALLQQPTLVYACRSASSRSACTRCTARGFGSSSAHRTSSTSAARAGAGAKLGRCAWRACGRAGSSSWRRVPAGPASAPAPVHPRTLGVAAAQRLLVHGGLCKLGAAAPLIPAVVQAVAWRQPQSTQLARWGTARRRPPQPQSPSGRCDCSAALSPHKGDGLGGHQVQALQRTPLLEVFSHDAPQLHIMKDKRVEQQQHGGAGVQGRASS